MRSYHQHLCRDTLQTSFPASQMLQAKQRADIKSKLKFLDEGWHLENKEVEAFSSHPELSGYISRDTYKQQLLIVMEVLIYFV